MLGGAMNDGGRNVSCFLCVAVTPTAVVYRDETMQIVRCCRCGLMYQNPRPSESTFHRNSYSEEYFRDYMLIFEKQRRYFSERYKTLFTKHKGARVLDVGCGVGSFLSAAKDYGLDVYGVEVSKWAAQLSREKVGKNIITGTLEDARFDDGMFDIIHMSHVLEHCEDPERILVEAGRILKMEGRLLIEVPNEKRFLWRLRVVNMVRRLFVHNKKPLKPYPEHLSLYTRRTLKRVIEKAGLKVTEIHIEGFSDPHRFQANVIHYRPMLAIVQMILKTRIDVILGLGYFIVATVARKDSK